MSDPSPTPDDDLRTADRAASRPASTAPEGAPEDASTRPDDSIATRGPDGPGSTTIHRPGPMDGRDPVGAVPGYDLYEMLGEGGMGVVYRARQAGLKRDVALKMILGGGRADRSDVIRFLAEAEAVASIKHPHVVQVYESGEADGRPFLAMEYLPGGSLGDLLAKRGRLAPRDAAAMVVKLARAVQAAHDQGIVHRDLKPANILFDDAGEPKVTDFGLAKRAAGSDLTRTQAVMGTPAYMAPEQARGETKFVGPQADVYALGVILYECLAGSRPFHHADTFVLLRKVAEDEPERPSRHVAGLPRDLELIALKCLAKDPVDRYQTAGALADDLDRFLAGEPVSVRAAGTVERAVKWARRKPTLAAAYVLSAAVLVLGGFGASLAVLWRDAERARGSAVLARDAEGRARADAESAHDAERRARETLARFDYGRTIQIARQELRDKDVVSALSLLEGTRTDLRGWEWRHVFHLCGAEVPALKGHTAPVLSTSWSPDGTKLLTASYDKTARIWDARSGAAIRTLAGHGGRLTSASWSPDGSRVVTASWDDSARVWDAKSGAPILSLEGHPSMVTSASYSPDGSRIVTSGADRTARIWDASTGAQLLALKGHAGLVASASWSPDGSRVVSAS